MTRAQGRFTESDVTTRHQADVPESAQRLAHVEGGGISETVAVGGPVPATRPVLLLVAGRAPTADGACVHVAVEHVAEATA